LQEVLVERLQLRQVVEDPAEVGIRNDRHLGLLPRFLQSEQIDTVNFFSRTIFFSIF
jgi:hypothetical protein